MTTPAGRCCPWPSTAPRRRPRSGTSPSGPGCPSPTSSRSSWPSRAPVWSAPSGASGGGYVLARPPEEISLAQIVSAVDGPIAAGDFGEPHANGACDHEGQCVLLAVWADVGETIRTHLQSYSLADMVDRAQGNVAAPV